MRINEYTLKRVKEQGYNYNYNLDSSKAVYNFCNDKLKMNELVVEKFLVFALDSKLKITGFTVVSSGVLDSALIHPRNVFNFLILSNAKSFICVHNHPSGDYNPSVDDFNITRRLEDIGDIIDIKLIDHIIYTNDDYYSFAENGKI